MERIELKPEAFGIFPDTGKDLTTAFRALFEEAEKMEGEKLIRLLPGIYDFYPEAAERPILYITNTIGERERKVPVKTIPTRISNVKNLTLEAEGAEWIMHGAMTNLFIDRCNNITVKGLAFDSAEPMAFEAEVVEKKLFSAKFQFSADVKYRLEGGRPIFYGSNFEFDTMRHASFQYANVKCSAEENDRIYRSSHPFLRAVKFRDLGNNCLEVFYFGMPKISVGDRIALLSQKRDEVGIFVSESENVTLDGVKEYFNLSHAYVCQCSKNVTLKNVYNAPREGSGKILASVTDLCHFSMCSGKITVKDSYFSGASDDVINVHGFHFKLLDVNVDTITVCFKHPQSYGYPSFAQGDEIEFIRRDTLVPTGKTAIVQSAKMTDPYTFSLLLDRAVDKDVSAGFYMVENISRCADLEFTGNRMNMITTRGVLVTTRGKVLIENNDFYKLGMSGVLVSDDARSWYESGAVRDVTIRGNRFTDCGDQAVRIWPEYMVFGGAVHKNIVIEENEIESHGTAIRIRGAENVLIRANRITGDAGKTGFIEEKNSVNVKHEKNIIKDET